MKYYTLTKEEKQLLKDIETGNYVSVGNFKAEKKKYQTASRYTFGKQKNINIRISAKDLFKLKRRAAEKGIPYQTIASSILHQYSNDNSS